MRINDREADYSPSLSSVRFACPHDPYLVSPDLIIIEYPKGVGCFLVGDGRRPFQYLP